VPVARQVAMPQSTSFPSGHAASAFAFAVVADSRVHTGVHFPGDVVVGAVTGAALAPLAVAARRRRRASITQS
jgi:membrane-associated phospholipid phosphatase